MDEELIIATEPSPLNKLNDRDRRMILTRYESGKNVSAAATGIVAPSKAPTRPSPIRKALFDCVSFEVSTEQVYEFVGQETLELTNPWTAWSRTTFAFPQSQA